MPRAKTPTRTPSQKKELINESRRTRKKATVSQLKAAFKDYDVDGDGRSYGDSLDAISNLWPMYLEAEGSMWMDAFEMDGR